MNIIVPSLTDLKEKLKERFPDKASGIDICTRYFPAYLGELPWEQVTFYLHLEGMRVEQHTSYKSLVRRVCQLTEGINVSG